jgi:uncharacterized protein
MPLCDGLQVIRSPIHGYGVIATRAFRKGETLCEGEGVIYHEDAEFDDTYSLVFDGDVMDPPIDEQVFYDLVCQTRWINHSCDPNTSVDSRWDARRAHPVASWTANRDIVVGEELTYDYAFTASCAEPCGCQSKSCRGLIIDQDEIASVSPELRIHLRIKQ